MITLLARHFIGLLLTLFIVSLLIFAVMDLLPGDPASIMLGTSQARKRWRRFGMSSASTSRSSCVTGDGWLASCRGISANPTPMAFRLPD